MFAPRTFRWEDLPSLLGLMREARRSDGDLRTLDEASLEEYLRDPGLDPERCCHLFYGEPSFHGEPGADFGDAGFYGDAGADSELRGYLILHHEPTLRRTVLEMGLHPAHRTDALRQQALALGLEEADAVGSLLVHVCVPKGDRSWDYALEKTGFSQAQSYWLMRWEGTEPPQSSPQAPPPEGFWMRTLQPGEGELLAAVQNAAFGGSWGFSPNTPEQAEHRAAMRNTGAGGVLLLEHGDGIAGYCWTFTEQLEQGPPIGTISMIGIHPSYRSRGLSKPILAKGMQHLCANGVGYIKLDVDSDNRPAIGLYTGVGFKKDHELHWFEAVL